MSDKRLGNVPWSLRGVSCPCCGRGGSTFRLYREGERLVCEGCGSIWMVSIEQSLSLVPDLEAMRKKQQRAQELVTERAIRMGVERAFGGEHEVGDYQERVCTGCPYHAPDDPDDRYCHGPSGPPPPRDANCYEGWAEERRESAEGL